MKCMSLSLRTRSRGFTLLELLVVVGLIAVVSAIAAAALNQARQRAQVAAAAQFAKSLDTRLIGDAEAAVVGMWNMESTGGPEVVDVENGNNLVLQGNSAWDLDDTPLDVGGSIRCATDINTCLFINGIRLENGTELNANTQTEVTMALWVKFDALPSSYVNVSRVGGNTVMIRALSNGSMRVLFSAAGVDMIPAERLKTGRWYHLALIYDGTKAEFYVNGTRAGVDESVTPVALGGHHIYVGSGAGAHGTQMKVWNPRIFYTAGI